MKLDAKPFRPFGAGASLAFVLPWILLLATSRSAESAQFVNPVVITNYVVVTNVVVVTNYVVATNLVLSTNGVAASGANWALPDLSWIPPEDGFDWIQLKSGEWLKGSIKAMQERVLEFDSDELKLLTFDWKNIRQLRSPHLNEMLFEKHGKISGPVSISPDQVTVEGAEPVTIDRRELQSITPGGSKERNYWSGKISMGLTVRGGNTRSVDYNALISAQRRTTDTRLKFDYLGNLSTVDKLESANNNRVNSEFDFWLSRRLYLILPQVEYFEDTFQNIQHRATLGGGVGYDIVDRRNLEWNVSTGPAYQKTWFDSVQAGQSTAKGQVALTFGSKFDWEITQRLDLLVEYRGQYTSRQVGETLHHAVSTFSIELTKTMDLDLSFVWDRTQSPKQDGNGTVPKKDDFRLIVSFGLRL